MIYLDHAATAPLHPSAAQAMAAAMADSPGNPSSVHAAGRGARARFEEARARVKAALGWEGGLVFTSGGTEALALALARAKPPRRIASAVEHNAVHLAVPSAEILPVDAHGLVDPSALGRMLAQGPPALVAIQHANNETGVLQPLDELASVISKHGGLLLADCVQGAGKLPLPRADFIAVSAHKLGGPAGVGALLVRDFAGLEAAGAGQEQGYRPGTENMLGAIGFAAAAEAYVQDCTWLAEAASRQSAIETAAKEAGAMIAGEGAPRLPTISCVVLPGADAMTQLIALDLEGFAVSAGAACSSGRVKASHVLLAMRFPDALAGQAIRVSTGRETSDAEADGFALAYRALAARLRKLAA